MTKSLIFDIKRYAINDGPGIRIVIFFKGCNLHCAWCHNPESIKAETEKLYSVAKCIRCSSCIDVCPANALSLQSSGIVTDTDLCTLCGKCADVCPTKAMEMSGHEMSLTEIMTEIEKEKVFFDQSGGGVTFSGGEPLLHSQLLFELLDECGKKNIHRAVDTAGNVSSKIILEAATRTDLFLYDLKMMDSKLHRKWTHAGNSILLKNLELLADTGVPIILRIPLIANINDTKQNIENTAAFISKLGGEPKEVHLLPYHSIAQHKYAKLGRADEFGKLQEPDKNTLQNALQIFASYGITASIGG